MEQLQQSQELGSAEKRLRCRLLPAKYQGAAVAAPLPTLKADVASTMQSRDGLRGEDTHTPAAFARRNVSVVAVDVSPLLTKKENAVEGA